MTHDDDSDDGDIDNDNNRIVTTQIISGTAVVAISPTPSTTVTVTLCESDVLNPFSTVRQVQPNSDESIVVVSSLATMSSSEAESTIPSDVNTHREFGVQELNDLVLNANARHRHKRGSIQRIETYMSLID